MSEHLDITATDKEGRYRQLLPQLEAIAEGDVEPIGLLANFSSAIHYTFGFLWTGFYRYLPQRSCLGLGPFQGPLACTEIKKGRGVCGTSWAEDCTIVVEDVDQFPGHIACSSSSRSEIVVPLHKADGSFWGVLDIDSAEIATFDTVDSRYLEQVAAILSPHLI